MGSNRSDIAAFIENEIRFIREDVRSLRVAPSVTSAEIRKRLEPYTFTQPLQMIDALGDVTDMLRKWSLHPVHPRYFGLFVPGTHEAGIWGDALAAIYNPQVGAWWYSPAANEIEIHTLQFLASTIGYDAGAAHWSGASNYVNQLPATV